MSAEDLSCRRLGRPPSWFCSDGFYREMEVAVLAAQERSVSYGSSLDAKELVRQAIDIVDLVGQFISLRRQGRNFVGLCPWHDDSRPSLQVNPERQSFKCWVCDIGGDAFSFIQRMEGVSFPEALEMLAERAGIELKPRTPAKPGVAGGDPSDKRTLYQAMAWAAKQYHECLLSSPEAEPARKYLDQRGLSAESIARFQLGFSPLERDWLLRRIDRNPQRAKVLETIGILSRATEGGQYDRFRGRVLFTIRDAQGRPVGIGGRLLPELGLASPAKYVNSPETPLFTKSKLLYGLDLARDAIRQKKCALIMEGYTDVIVAHQFGFHHAVAVLGTALGSDHIRTLKHYSEKIVLVLDGDEAGQKRTKEVIGLFLSAQSADVRVLTLPDGLDPCDFLQQRGPAALEELLTHSAVDALDHLIEAETRGIDVERDLHAADQAVERILTTVAQAPRLGAGTSHDDRIREEKALARVAFRLRLREEDVRKRLAGLRRRAPAGAKPRRIDPAESPQARTPAEPLDPWRRELFELLLAHPDCWATAQAELSAEWLAAGPTRPIYETCCRLLAAGVEPNFERLMLELDEPCSKSLLVDLDEQWRAKGPRGAEPSSLLGDWLKTFQGKEVEKRRPAQIVALREGRLDDSQTANLLEAILQQERSRQGISAPKDG